MLKNEVFESVKKSELPDMAKVINSTWACKKKSNRVLCGRLNARLFKHVEGQHYNGASIHAPLTNARTICIILTLMLIAGWVAAVVNEKGSFLRGEFHNGEEIYMKVPQGWEGYCSNSAVLKLLKCIYGLKQAAMVFLVELL